MTFLKLLAIVLACVVVPDKKDTVPLKNIWALNMPGTKNLKALEPDIPLGITVDELHEKSTIYQIVRKLSYSGPRLSDHPEPGFVVLGTSETALKNARDVLTEKSKRRDLWLTSDEFTLVFATKISSRNVHLDSVERSRNKWTVNYHFESQIDADLSPNLALIPMGKLKPGKYIVRIVRGPTVVGRGASDKPLDKRYVSRVIPDSFEFVVTGEK